MSEAGWVSEMSKVNEMIDWWLMNWWYEWWLKIFNDADQWWNCWKSKLHKICQDANKLKEMWNSEAAKQGKK